MMGADPSCSLVRLEQPTDGLASVASGACELLFQLPIAPRRHTAGVPFLEEREGLAVVEREAAHEAAANAERLHVAVVSCDRGRQRRQVASRALEPPRSRAPYTVRKSAARFGSLLRFRKVGRTIDAIHL